MDTRIEPDEQVALVVDLDGTLVRSDMLVEGLLQLAGQAPGTALRLLAAHAKEPARLKAEVARRTSIDPATLPYNRPLLARLEEEASRGRPVYLATAAHEDVAHDVARHLGFFRGVLASDGARNLKGARKLEAVRDEIGPRPFTYFGDNRADRPLWEAARSVGLVNVPAALAADPALAGKEALRFDFDRNRPRALLRGMRPHQWTKNLLVFLPLLAAHEWADAAAPLLSLLAFVAFSAAASGVYLLNDLLDMEDDRHHPSKRRRPVPAGEIAAPFALAVAVALILGALAVSALVSPPLGLVVLIYVAATSLYSIDVKRRVGVDLIWLAGLYSLRVVGGAAATGIEPSTWLLSFSVFVFLSLACAKRAAELVARTRDGTDPRSRRGYRVPDLQIVSMFGVVAGFSSLIVLLIYFHEPQTAELYGEPRLLLIVGLVLLYWLNRLWLKVWRDEMHHDPVVFALRDRRSTMALGAMVAAFTLAKIA